MCHYCSLVQIHRNSLEKTASNCLHLRVVNNAEVSVDAVLFVMGDTGEGSFLVNFFFLVLFLRR